MMKEHPHGNSKEYVMSEHRADMCRLLFLNKRPDAPTHADRLQYVQSNPLYPLKLKDSGARRSSPKAGERRV
jgi:hypothetical protein